jgi:hypothetical protein
VYVVNGNSWLWRVVVNWETAGEQTRPAATQREDHSVLYFSLLFCASPASFVVGVVLFLSLFFSLLFTLVLFFVRLFFSCVWFRMRNPAGIGTG